MRKGWIIVLVLMVFSLSGCKEEIVPVDVDMKEYSVFYDGGDYVLYKADYISDIQYTICISLEKLEDDSCCLGITQQNAFIVGYNSEYYDLQGGVNLGLFDTYDLIEAGVPMQCHLLDCDGNNVEREVGKPSGEGIGEIGEFTIYVDTSPVCEMVVGSIVIDGYDFGYFNSGCDDSIDTIGYVAYRLGFTYQLSTLVEEGYLTVEEIHTFYMNDENHRGNTDLWN
jgi:hypothetical protein